MMTINKFVRVEDDKTIARETNSKAIVNIDSSSLAEYKKIKQKRIEKNQKILECENDINTLKDEVTDIKDSLRLILDKLNSRD